MLPKIIHMDIDKNINKSYNKLMIKVLIFDCYGTIISTGNGSIEATKNILKNLKSDIDPIIFYKTWKNMHKENIKYLKQFCKEKTIFVNDLKKLFEKYNINGNHKNSIKPMLDSLYNRKFYDDVVINLKQLKNDYNIYIASNSDTEPLMENVGNEKYLFNGIYTSETLKAYKPSKIFFKKLLEKIKCNKDEILFVGNSLEDDIIGANAVGLKTVLLNRNNTINIDTCISSYMAKDFYELNNILINNKRQHCT
jgi:2-haloalkanoic acid dehalogenase type II